MATVHRASFTPRTKLPSRSRKDPIPDATPHTIFSDTSIRTHPPPPPTPPPPSPLGDRALTSYSYSSREIPGFFVVIPRWRGQEHVSGLSP